MSILEIKNIAKAFGSTRAVDGVSFQVEPGEIYGLLGPNGAGKTTTISMLSCLLEPSGGDAQVGGHSVTRDPMAVKHMIGVVPQDLALYETLTANQNLLFWGRMYGMNSTELKQRIVEVLEQVGLTDRANSRVETYSGGMKRRLNIAVGLLHRPELVFMDEPTVGIDPQSRRSILDMVKALQAQGMTVLYTTHYMEEAAELSDRVGIIDHGQLIALGTQEELTQLVGQQEVLRLHFASDVPVEQTAQLFSELDEVLNSTAVNGAVALTVAQAEEALPAVVTKTQAAGLRLQSIDIEQPNLESVFLHLTGRALRD